MIKKYIKSLKEAQEKYLLGSLTYSSLDYIYLVRYHQKYTGLPESERGYTIEA